MRLIIAIFIGSGLGGVCRYLLSNAVNGLFSRSAVGRAAFLSEFPWGTFAVNVVGCFLIGLIYGLVDRNIILTQEAKLLLTTGFCGGLTTFSTFSHENLILFHGNNHVTLIIYAVASLIVGFTFAYLGHAAVAK